MIRIICVGKIKKQFLKDAIADYRDDRRNKKEGSFKY